jgi:two-component system, NarL family, response regulator NreC
MAKIRVLLADDHAVLRAGLRMLVSHQPDMEVVGEAGTFAETIRLGSIVKPDVITLDLTMPDASGMEKVEQVCRECAGARVLVLTMHDDPAYLRASLCAGASGYVVKKAADTELLGAIRAVHAGRAFVDLELHGARPNTVLVAASQPGESDSRSASGDLSDREVRGEATTKVPLGRMKRRSSQTTFLSHSVSAVMVGKRSFESR